MVKPKTTVPSNFSTIQTQRELRGLSRSQSGGRSNSIEHIAASKVAMHRFTDYVVDMKSKQKQLKVLNPSRLHTDKSPPRI